MAIIQEFDLNMIPDSAPVVIHADQYDKGTGRFRINLYNGNTAYTPSSATVKIQGTKPDKKGFSYSASISGNVVTANLTEQMTAVPGRVRVNIVVTEGSNRTGTFIFWLDVQATGLSNDVDVSETVLPEYIEGAKNWANIAKSWAVGPNGSGEAGTDSNNAEFWAKRAQYWAGQSESGADLGAKVFGVVVGDTLTLTGDDITANVIVTGPYFEDTLIGIKSVVRDGNTLTYTLTDDSADGVNAFIYVKEYSTPPGPDPDPDPEPTEKTLLSITVTGQPSKTVFTVGDELDLSGIAITASYSDDSTAEVSHYCTSDPLPGSTLTTEGVNTITLSYTEGGVTKTTTINITVVEKIVKVLSSLSMTSMPSKGSYVTGDTIDLTGMVVEATYTDGSTEDVTDKCLVDPPEGTYITSSSSYELFVTVSYSSGGVSKHINLSFPVNDSSSKKVENVTMTKNPTKSSYVVGEALDLTGMRVIVTYEDFTTKDVTSMCVSDPAEGTIFEETGGFLLTVTYSNSNETWTYGGTVEKTFNLSGMVCES
ncbi:MAG: bacterial Ig-like domain-containing protein [Lachnospiraceae bacterium]|nr:bacterial Ig-like domain-containing protein [Lachnospiraceae bacterium]